MYYFIIYFYLKLIYIIFIKNEKIQLTIKTYITPIKI